MNFKAVRHEAELFEETKFCAQSFQLLEADRSRTHLTDHSRKEIVRRCEASEKLHPVENRAKSIFGNLRLLPSGPVNELTKGRQYIKLASWENCWWKTGL